MPDSPDFEQIAKLAVRDIPIGETEDIPIAIEAIAEQLRQVWNARGAADAKAVEERLSTLTGWVASEPYRQHLREAIEALNR